MTSFLRNRTHTLGPYRILYPSHMKVETYACQWYDGIVFHVDDTTYDVINNYVMGPRLVITTPPTGSKDVPFHSGSWWLLPEGITVEKEDEDAR